MKIKPDFRFRVRKVYICEYLKPDMKAPCYIDLCNYCLNKLQLQSIKENPYNKSRFGFRRKCVHYYKVTWQTKHQNTILKCAECGFKSK